MIAAKIASEGEVAIEHLLLLAPAGLGKEIDAGFIDGMIAADSVADLEGALSKLDGGALSSSYLQELLARIQSRRPMLRALANSINDGGTQRHSIVSDLERVKVPVTAIFGLKDRVIPWQHAAQLPAHAAVHFVKNAGHMPHWAAPNLAADLLLGRHRARRGTFRTPQSFTQSATPALGAAVGPFWWRVGMNIFYIIGVVVVVAVILGYLGLG